MSDLANRINRAIDHITRNLASSLSLEEVASVAAFSPFHFHRVFRGMTGETLHAFVKRVRLERALYLMSHRPQMTLTEVALETGFAQASDFSRSFRARYGVPPSVIDLRTFRESHRAQLPPEARVTVAPTDKFDVKVYELPARRLAYTRVFDPYAGGVPAACAKMVAWAEERGLADNAWFGMSWDEPELVDPAACRYDVAVEIGKAEVDLNVLTLPAMTVAEIAVVGPLELESRAFDWLYDRWLPTSGYVPDHQPAFEAWDGRPYAHGFEHYTLRAQLPVIR